MSNLTSMSKKDTAPKSGEDEKVNWFAELRGLAIMLLVRWRRRRRERGGSERSGPPEGLSVM